MFILTKAILLEKSACEEGILSFETRSRANGGDGTSVSFENEYEAARTYHSEGKLSFLAWLVRKGILPAFKDFQVPSSLRRFGDPEYTVRRNDS